MQVPHPHDSQVPEVPVCDAQFGEMTNTVPFQHEANYFHQAKSGCILTDKHM